jgi:hypothetical protein
MAIILMVDDSLGHRDLAENLGRVERYPTLAKNTNPEELPTADFPPLLTKPCLQTQWGEAIKRLKFAPTSTANGVTRCR